HAIGVPSTGLSLGWLLASRASLRFTRQDRDTEVVSEEQEQSRGAGQADLHGISEGTLIFCPKDGVHLSQYAAGTSCIWGIVRSPRCNYPSTAIALSQKNCGRRIWTWPRMLPRW